MSIEATVWALKKAAVPDPISHLVLIGLADHASADGSGAWPSVKTIATYARCHVRSVHNKLRLLEARGLIIRGDQRIVAHLPGDRRPVVYDLPIHGVHEVHVVDDGVHAARDGVHGATSRGARLGSNGVHAGAHKPSMNHPEPSIEHSSAVAEGVGVDGDVWTAIENAVADLSDAEACSAAAMIHHGYDAEAVVTDLLATRDRTAS